MLQRLFLWAVLAFLTLGMAKLSAQTTVGSPSLKDYWSTCPEFNSEQKDLVLDALDKKTELKLPYRIYGDLTLLEATEDMLSLRSSKVSVCTIQLLAHPKLGQIIALIRTVTTPTEDSQISFYTQEWKPLPTAQFISLPRARDFLRGSTSAEALLPYLSPLYACYSMGSDALLSIKLSTPTILSDEERAKLSADFAALPSLSYRWDKSKGRFLPIKEK